MMDKGRRMIRACGANIRLYKPKAHRLEACATEWSKAVATRMSLLPCLGRRRAEETADKGR